MSNVYNGLSAGVIKTNRSPVTHYAYDRGGVKPAPQHTITRHHRVVPPKIMAVSMMANMRAFIWSDMV